MLYAVLWYLHLIRDFSRYLTVRISVLTEEAVNNAVFLAFYILILHKIVIQPLLTLVQTVQSFQGHWLDHHFKLQLTLMNGDVAWGTSDSLYIWLYLGVCWYIKACVTHFHMSRKSRIDQGANKWSESDRRSIFPRNSARLIWYLPSKAT